MGAARTDGMARLPVEDVHIAAVQNLPHHHRDPFDRMLIAQAGAEGVPILTGDAAFDAYGLPLIPASL